jgi:DNA-binding MarR family transcriptional regulator
MTRELTPPDARTGAIDGNDIDRLEQQFGRLFDAYRQRLRERSADVDPSLQPSGYRTLLTVVKLGPVGAAQLAEALGFDKSVLSRQLHQLEKLGLVTRAQDPADRRAVIVAATPVGLARVEALGTVDRDEFRSRIAGWDRHDLNELVRLLGLLSGE